jgi:hypothetical protein
MWKRAVGTRQEVNTERRKLNLFWMVSVVQLFYFMLVLYCCYIWSLTPIIELVCLLLFSVLLFGNNSHWFSSDWLRFECMCTTKSSLGKFYCSHHDFINRYGIYVSKMTTDISVWCNHNAVLIPQSWLITVCVTRLTRRVLLVEQELFTLLRHLSSHLVLNGVCWARFLYFYIVFCILFFVGLFHSPIVIFKHFVLESCPGRNRCNLYLKRNSYTFVISNLY